MTPATKPSHQQVREFMAKRREAHTPPPTPEEFRRELGWAMLEEERELARSTK